jgi:hypothetical protein
MVGKFRPAHSECGEQNEVDGNANPDVICGKLSLAKGST